MKVKLNIEQRKIIELEPNGHSLVKGVAGSGKTTVAIHRLLFLQKHYCPKEDDSILLLTFNKTLLSFIKYQYERLETEDELSFQELFASSGEVHIENIDKLMFSFFKAYQNRHKSFFKIISTPVKRKFIQQATLQLKHKYSDVKLLSPKYSSFLMDEIDWIIACDIQGLDAYQDIERTGRANGGQDNSPQRLNRHSRTRQAIYELMEVYHTLLEKNKLVDFKLMNKMALEEANQAKHNLYTHIIIDESQDLSKVQLKFIQALHADKSYASVMFVADNTQSIYSQSWLGKGRPYTSIGYDMSGKSRTLSKNYRTTTEISKAAYALIENDESIRGNIDFVKPSLIDRHGHEPVYSFFTSPGKQSEFIINEIKKLADDYSLRDICIVAKEKRLLEDAATVLEASDIAHELLTNSQPNFEKDTVKLTTMHSIKGLEFKVIFLINLDAGIIPNETYNVDDSHSFDSEERKLLYVGMTRANELLYMSSVRMPSKFIKELNRNTLRLKKDSAFHPFKSISIQDYRLTDSIADLNSKEEVVRQWMLKELHETFGYPLELMSLEYPVQRFSQRGYVDIAVNINRSNEIIPYIFIEVKPFSHPLEDALEQLSSYIQTSPTVQYGVVSNGIDVKVINRDGEEMLDVPPCQPQFLPTNKHERRYIDLRHHKSYDYYQDKENQNYIEIKESQTDLFLSQSPSIPVPLIGDVAAGIPSDAIEEYSESVLLMDNWVIKQQDTFALRVTGDSMVNAGIEKGDYVIVNSQNTVSNGDIAIVLIDNQATMKTFTTMGSSIVLMSANSNYEPIIMNADDVIINGKVIGVLK